jgi:hypothetical protein
LIGEEKTSGEGEKPLDINAGSLYVRYMNICSTVKEMI